MKLFLSLALISSCMMMQASEEQITYTVAENWQEVDSYKETAYFPFFEKVGFKKEYLETRWGVFEDLYKTKLVSIILLQQSKKDAGFLSIEAQNENLLLYTSPILIKREEIDPLLTKVAQELYPEVKTGYCMVAQNNKPLAQFVMSLGWKETETCPIAPNQEFIKGSAYTMYTKKLGNN